MATKSPVKRTPKSLALKPIKAPILQESTSTNPLVFISHDTRDAELAEAFSQLLSNSSMGILESFRSSDKRGTQGIEYGTLWYDEILRKLTEASDVVCLLTNNSIDRPWILYEAGIAIGKSNTPLIGIALGIPLQKANNGPFAQFQNCADDVDSLTKLVSSLIRKIPNAKPTDDVVKGPVLQFLEKIKPILEKQQISEAVDGNEGAIVEDTPVAKLFEEIKIMFQDLPSRIDRNINSDGRKSRKIHPMMLEDLMHFTMKKDDSIGITMVLSLFRNDIPWIYDFGIDLIKTLKSKVSIPEKERAMKDFEKMLDFTFHHGILHEMYFNSKEERIYRELPHILMSNLHRLHDRQKELKN